MLNRIVALAALALITGAFWAGAARAASPDVPLDHWAYDAVSYLEDQGFVIGYPDGTFGGDRTLTRYEFAMVISRVYDQFIEKLDAASADEPGVDVQAVIDLLMEEFQPDIDELRQLIDANTQRVETLEGTVGGIDTRVTDLTTRVDGLQSGVKTQGDLTLRFEGMYPNKGLQTQRPRFMLHYGFTTQVTDELKFGGRFASGTADSRQSTFDTFDDAFGIDPLNIDQAYMQWTPASAPGFTAWGGKFAPPWKSGPMVWDSDVMVEGLAQRYTEGDFTLNLAELVPAVEGYYVVAQAAVNNLGWKDNTVALTYHYINDKAWGHIVGDMNDGTLTSKFDFSRLESNDQYQAIEAYWEWKACLGDVPIKFQGNYLLNLADTAKVEESLAQPDGWQQACLARLIFNNTPTEPGQWNIWGEYGRVEPNSVLSWITDAWRGSGDAQFWAVGWNYRLLRNTDFNLSYISADRISSDASFTDVLVNISTKFD